MAAITLDDVVLEQRVTNETLGQLREQTIINFENQGLNTLIDQFGDFLDMVRTQMRIADEARREQGALPPPVSPTVPTPSPKDTPNTGSSIPLFTGVAFGVAAFAGAVEGVYDTIRQSFTKAVTKIEDFAKLIKDKFVRLGQIFKDLGARFFRVINFTKGAKELGELISKFIAPIKDFFTGLKNNPIVRFFGRLGQLFGRLALPIFLAIDIIKGIMGEFEDLDETATIGDKFIAAMKGFQKGLLNFFLMPLDLLKDLTSWILDKIGFEDVSSKLDSFSIADFAGSVVDLAYEKVFELATSVKDAISSVFEWVGGLPDRISGFVNQSIDDLSTMMNTIGTMALNGIKSLVLAALPPADFATFELPKADLGILGQFGGGSINLNPIPNSVYEWAGSPSPSTISGDTDNSTSSSNLTNAIGGTNNSSTVTNAINQESVANAGNSQANTVVIQDNSVSSAQTNNTQNTAGSGRSMPSPMNDNRTRASAYAG